MSETKTLSFEELINFVFDHPVSNPAWYFNQRHIWMGDPAHTLGYFTKLFEQPHRLAQRFSPEQIAQGFWFLIGESGSDYLYHLYDKEIPVIVRERCVRAIYPLFRDLFCVICPGATIEERQRNSLSDLVFRWWEVFPSWEKSDDSDCQHMDDVVLSTLQRILQIPSTVCHESALQGLCHWRTYDPTKVDQIIRGFLDKGVFINPALRKYATAIIAAPAVAG